MVLKLRGYPKLKKLIDDRGLATEIANLLNLSDIRLSWILEGKNEADFYIKDVTTVCLYLNINPDDYFF